MRNIFPSQRTIGEIDIADIKIDVRSRDDMPLILLGVQHIYCTDGLREKVFEIIKEILPTQVIDGQPKPVSAELDCPGMNQQGRTQVGRMVTTCTDPGWLVS